MEDEETEMILDVLAEEFERYPFDIYTGLEVSQIIKNKLTHKDLIK